MRGFRNLLPLACVAALLAPPARAAALSRGVLAQGGQLSSGSGRVVHATVGQPVIGRSAAGRAVSHGFWWAAGALTTGVEAGPGGSGRPINRACGSGRRCARGPARPARASRRR